VNEKDVTLPYFGKVSQGFLYTLNGVPTPPLTSSPSNQTLLEYLNTTAEYPLILKHNVGVMGLHNFLVSDATELQKVLSQPLQGFVAQPFIKNTGELRVLTFGKNVAPFIFRKYATAESHLNNTSRGGAAEQVAVEAVNPLHLEHALRAAELTNREVGGVDVLLAENGEHYILEVNSTPAIASGVFADEKIARYSDYISRKLVAHSEEQGK
jgi:glutathione synthase/RimK-type ligase-like ATP-grasp enzyme